MVKNLGHMVEKSRSHTYHLGNGSETYRGAKRTTLGLNIRSLILGNKQKVSLSRTTYTAA